MINKVYTKLLNYLSKTELQYVLLIGFFFFFISVPLSIIIWRSDYKFFDGAYCPDAYCIYAEKFYNLFAYPTRQDYLDLEKFFEGSIISTSPLAPLFIGFINLGLHNIIYSFIFSSILCSLTTLSIIIYEIKSSFKLKINREISIFIIILCVHLVFIRALARTMTDAVGILAIITDLFLIFNLTNKYSTKKALYFSLIIYVSLFARVSVFPIILFSILWFIFKFFENKKWNYLEGAFMTSIIPGLLFILTTASFDAVHTIFGAIDTARGFKDAYNFKNFIKVLVVVFQIFPVIWILGRKLFVKTEIEKLHLFWIIFYFAFMILGQGALWYRYFVPIIPSIILISIKPFIELKKRNIYLYYSLIGLIILINIIPTIILIIRPDEWRIFIANYFY